MKAVFHSSITELHAEQWDALWSGDYPFTRYDFLAALESSGSVDTSTDSRTGWIVEHLTLSEDGELMAAMPLFKKTHSYGEYVFDWSWASAYDQARLNYYPKLLNAIPFTPATGPRIAFNSNLTSKQQSRCAKTLFEVIKERVKEMQYSGFHALFPEAKSASFFPISAFHQRFGYQFHWLNQNYESFEHFLEDFSSRKRKNIRKERKKTNVPGLELKTRHAIDVTDDEWEFFYALYHRTYLKRSGHSGYLGQGFFQSIARAFPRQVVLVSAHHQQRMIAAAFYLRDKHTLYGRYWGTEVDIDGLHFECCYYRGIEYAIEQSIKRFDPGAQGEHKIQRGFTPVKTQSFHQMSHQGFHQGIGDFVKREAPHIDLYIDDARKKLPFREDLDVVPADFLTSFRGVSS